MSTHRRKTGAAARSTEAPDKQAQLEPAQQEPPTHLSTAQGLAISDNHNALKAGERGPLLVQDLLLHEKLAHFAHERIPERVVNARGAGAHGVFKVYKPLSEYTTAAFLQDPEQETPVFVRFSSLMGERGAPDTLRDLRGFAVKFYTSEGNFDLVGAHLPVFFIQDPMKFPDLVHALKPEPHHGMPQGCTAHDSFWDFASLMPETTHMLMWLMSDRALPRSWRMMEGFGVHSLQLVNSRGQAHLARFHWRPKLGVQTLTWDEAAKIAGREPDFHRRDLWEAIADGHHPEWELGMQAIPAGREDELGMDPLDPTQLIPEELLPITPIGRLVLNRNPENHFAEVEQSAFHPGHLLPGIDLSDDPLLQGRVLAYTHAQLHRLGGPNHHQLPINRPLAPVAHFQRDGLHQGLIHRGRVAYEPNTLAQGAEMRIDGSAQGFQTHPAEVPSPRVRKRSSSFNDHFSQATLFWNSQTAVGREHIIAAFRYDLARVETTEIRQRVVDNLAHVDLKLATRVAQPLGIKPPDAAAAAGRLGFRMPEKPTQPPLQEAPSLTHGSRPRAEGHSATLTRRLAVLVAEGVDMVAVRRLIQELEDAGIQHRIIAPHLGQVTTAAGRTLAVDLPLVGTASVLFDALLLPGGSASVQALAAQGQALHFVLEAYRHCKPICALGDGVQLMASLGFTFEPERGSALHIPTPGVILADPQKALEGEIAAEFIAAVAAHRHWDRLNAEAVPA